VSAERSGRAEQYAVRVRSVTLLLLVASCSWFTDFKEQPKVDPWDARPDSGPSRGQPQGSVSIYGTVAPEFAYARTPQALELMSSLTNPVPADSASIDRGRKEFQINCAVCHGPAGKGNGVVLKYGFFPPSIGPGSPAATKWSDGYIFGIIRNGRNLMPSYNRIEEPDRWDIVNYVRTLQTAAVPDTSHGLPGETGDKLPGVSQMGPTRPAPYYHVTGAQAGAREGLMGAPATTRPDSTTRAPAKPPAPAKKP